jgi:hypothetical protein
MVLPLVGYVLQDPLEVVLAETDHPIASLPIQNLPAQSLVDVMGTTALHLPHKSADRHKRLDVDGKVDMGCCSADTMEIDSFGVPASLDDVGMNLLVKLGGEQREVIFGMPVDVKIDFMEDMAGHCGRILLWRSPAEAG